MFRTLASLALVQGLLNGVYAFHNNVSSCVLNNCYSISSLAVEQVVR